MPLLEVTGLNVTLGGQSRLTDVDLSLDAGEVLGVVGESGSGKSLTALSILGLLPESAALEGSIRLDGQELVGLSDKALSAHRGRDIGIVFQEPQTALNPVLTIGAQVAEVVRQGGRVSRREARSRARAILDRVGLPAPRFPLGLYPHELSGGQRQRVAIAIAIALKPRLLIADEPTTALDVTTQAVILDLLRRLCAEDGVGLILISHDLAVVAGMADRIVVLKDGAAVETLSRPFDARPTTAYARRLVADAEHRARRRGAVDDHANKVLAVRGVSRDYRVRSSGLRTRQLRAVDDVSFEIRRGETVALIGESGSGKSTLLRTILGLDRPQAGDVQLLGSPFSGVSERARRPLRRHVQAVFQDPFASFDPRWRVEDVVAEPFHLLDTPPSPAERREAVERVLSDVSLPPDAADRFPHQFSGGQRQRIAIARALITEPALIVLDEAVSALDVTVRAGILDLLAELSERRAVSYLFITHDIGLVESFSDRVLVLKAGRILEAGPTAQVLASPANPYTAELIAATPRLGTAFRAQA